MALTRIKSFDYVTICLRDSNGEESGGATADTQSATCPVTDEPADPEISTEYKGKTVYFCCEDCVEKFLSDPESYTVAGK